MKPCETCGREFRVHLCAEKRGGGKYCSLTCRNLRYRGAGNPKWRGGRVLDKDGRVMVYAPNDPHATMFGGTHAYEYRIVAARKIGRPLAANEIVHHIDGDPRNNALENLEVMTQAEHARRHMIQRLEQKRA